VDKQAERDFTEFVTQRTGALFRMAYALTGNQHAAEDLLQNALAKAALRWRGIRGEAEPYVRRIMYHDAVSHWRWRRRHRETSTAAPPDRRLEDRSGDVDLRLALRDALLRLPPRQRAVLVLRYLDDLSEQQVADMLGCSTGTVGSQASRALANLRRSVGPTLLSAAAPHTAPEVSR